MTCRIEFFWRCWRAREKVKAQIEGHSYSVSWKPSFEESEPIFLCCLHKEFKWIGLFQQTKCFVGNNHEERGQVTLEKKAKSGKNEKLHRLWLKTLRKCFTGRISFLQSESKSAVYEIGQVPLLWLYFPFLSGVRIMPLINTAWANASAAASNDETLFTSLPPLFANCGFLFFLRSSRIWFPIWTKCARHKKNWVGRPPEVHCGSSVQAF